MMKTEQPQETIICGRGRLGTWAASQGRQRCPLCQGRALCQEIPALSWTCACHFVGKRCHGDWVQKATGREFIRSKEQNQRGFFFLILKEGYRSLLQKGTCHLFPLLLGISAIVCLLKETHKICLPASLTRALQEAPKL